MLSLRKASTALNTAILAVVVLTHISNAQGTGHDESAKTGLAVGSQYDTTHVYVAPADLSQFVASFTATFGGHFSKKIVSNVLPEPSSTEFQYVWTPSGNLSVFAFDTPIPYPFGLERTGLLVTDLPEAVKAARASGAEIVVEPFKDPIGLDAVVQWDGGVKTQLYWHTTAPNYEALDYVPENRVYISPDRADQFARQFVNFAHGAIVSDEKNADAGEIGLPGKTYRRIRIESGFGKLTALITDGHLPYPFGRELTGYQVKDLDSTVAKAKTAGASLLWGPYDAGDRSEAILQFPGGYIAEIHALKKWQHRKDLSVTPLPLRAARAKGFVRHYVYEPNN